MSDYEAFIAGLRHRLSESEVKAVEREFQPYAGEKPYARQLNQTA